MQTNFKVEDCNLVDMPVIFNEAGNISVLENGVHLPFDIERIYYLYDVPAGVERGGHAHRQLQQYVIAGSGSFNFVLDDGINKKEVFLNRPNVALHIRPGIWREMKDFSSGSICLVFASMKYTEEDYIRNYEDFLKQKFKI